MAVTPNYGWPVPVATDYVKDGWEAISDLGNAIDTTVATLGSGLTKISTSTLSGSSGQVLTGLTAGSRYRILINMYGSVDNEELAIRFRESSTDKITAYYGGSWYVSATGASAVYFQANNATYMVLGRFKNTVDNASFYGFDLFINSTQNMATITGNALVFSGGPYALSFAYGNSGMATCDGVNIYPVSGNATGTITLYKYQD